MHGHARDRERKERNERPSPPGAGLQGKRVCFQIREMLGCCQQESARAGVPSSHSAGASELVVVLPSTCPARSDHTVGGTSEAAVPPTDATTLGPESSRVMWFPSCLSRDRDIRTVKDKSREGGSETSSGTGDSRQLCLQLGLGSPTCLSSSFIAVIYFFCHCVSLKHLLVGKGIC